MLFLRLRYHILVLLFFISLSPLLFAQSKKSLDQAILYLQTMKDTDHLNDADISSYDIIDHYQTKHNGVNHIYLQQNFQGIKVFNGIININVLPNGEILNIGNRFISNIKNRINTTKPSISAEAAIRKVIEYFQVPTKNNLRIKEQVNENEYIFNKEGIALEDIKATLVFEALELKKVRLVWMIELYEIGAQNRWNARVDAITGEIVNYHNQVLKCKFETPDESCYKEHHHSSLDKKKLRKLQQNASPQNNNLANSYRVFAPPVESPNHGPHTLETTPSNSLASPFGWHDINGTTGAEYTTTRGNNVHAYQDISNLNNSSGDEPDGGPSLDFDFVLDLASTHPYSNMEPAVVNLFFWCNIMHDVWYLYGFDEAAGNFQVNNYGNGGLHGDHIRAEALDGSGTNFSNFSTNGDGTTARIQMRIYQYGGEIQDSTIVSVLSPTDIAGDYYSLLGDFGNFTTFTAMAPIVLVEDETAPTTNACEAITNGTDISGKIAMIDRGGCEFGIKMLEAENNGAIAVIMCNNTPGPPFPMGAGTVGFQVSIPGLMLSQADCDIIKAQLPDVTISLDLEVEQTIRLDGDLDNGIIAHEYGHGISIRGTGGPSASSCLDNNEQMGEGWSDWFALIMTIEPGDIGTEGRGIGTYVSNEPVTGNGYRTYLYSTDIGLNPHTYDSIAVESVPHGVGSVWCAMIWDMTWDLIDVYGFDPDLYNGTGGNNIAMQLVMDGIKLQPCDPGFVDARDAILAADMANNEGANQCLIWKAFARRGLGLSAVQGSPYSNTDGIENFDFPLACSPILYVDKTANESVPSEGTLTYTLEIGNNTSDTLNNVIITDSLPSGTILVGGITSCGGTESNGLLTIPIGNMEPGTILTCTYELMHTTPPGSFVIFYDDMESGNLNWTVSGSGPTTWEITNTNAQSGASAWYAGNSASSCDQYLTLTNAITLTGQRPTLAFWHKYETEDQWDGGVVEISINDGIDWMDLGSHIIKNGYNGPLNESNSPLSLRDAFHGNSLGYIQTFIDLSTYNSQSVNVRFRLGCDNFTGAPGWWVDDVQFLEDYILINNIACINSDLNENYCDSVITIIDGTSTISTSTHNSKPLIGVNLFPNPTTNLINIVFEDPHHMLSIRIISVDGKEMFSRSTIEQPSTQIEINIQDFDPGIYFVVLQSEKGMTTKKLVIQ